MNNQHVFTQHAIHRRRLLSAMALTALPGIALAQSPVRVSLGTATPGGGFPVYGEAFTKIINASDAGLLIEPRNTKGSYENMPLLERGELDLGLVAGEPAFEALSGVKGPVANLRIIAAMYATPGMFVVRGDSPYKTIGDLKGQSIVFGARGSGLPILARYVLDGMGLDQERDFKALFLDKMTDALPMLRDGRAVAVWGGGNGWPTFEGAMKDGGRFIAPSAQDIARIRAKHSYLGDLVLPANSYAGQPEPIRSVGSWSFVLARTTLADSTAYSIARALHRNEKTLTELLPQARETTAVNTVAAAAAFKPELLHSGARKYLQEAGLLK